MSKLTEDLRAMGIRNTLEIMQHADLKVAMFYHTEHAHAFGHKDYRVVIRFIDREGNPRVKTLRRSDLPDIQMGTAKENRERFFEGARKYFDEKMWRGEGTVEWVRDPFTAYGWHWIPKRTHDALMAEVKAWRAAQRITASNS
jgi:hypothetical protein